MTDKGEWLMYRAHVKGQSAQALLAGMVSTALAKLPIPKLMRWGDSDVQFVRPVHTVTMLLGADLIRHRAGHRLCAHRARPPLHGRSRVYPRQRRPIPADPAGARQSGRRLAKRVKPHQARRRAGGAEDWRQGRSERQPAGRSGLAGGMAGGADRQIRRRNSWRCRRKRWCTP